MSVQIHIPTPLRAYTDSEASVTVEASTVSEALAALLDRYPKLQKHLYDAKGKLRSFVNLYLADEDIRQLDGLDTDLDGHPRLVDDPDAERHAPLTVRRLRRIQDEARRRRIARRLGDRPGS